MVDAQARHAGDLHLRERRRSHGDHEGDADEAGLVLQKGNHHDDDDQALTAIVVSRIKAPAERVSAGASAGSAVAQRALLRYVIITRQE